MARIDFGDLQIYPLPETLADMIQDIVKGWITLPEG